MSFNYNFENDNPENPGYATQYDPSKSLIQSDLTIAPKEEKLRSRSRPKTSEELFQSFYSAREKAPVIDQAKIDRLQRMGRINQLGQGVKVLADIAGTAMGANVRRRQPDSTAPALFQSYQAMLDKYKDQTDAYDFRDYQAKRQNAQFGLQRADKETAQEFAARRQSAIEKNNEAKTALENSKFLASLRQKQEALNNTKAYQKGRLGIEGEKLKIAKEKNDQSKDKPFVVVGLDGAEIPLKQGEFRALLEKAGKDPDFKDYRAKKALRKDLSMEAQKNIIQRYYSHLENKKKKEAEEAKYQPIINQVTSGGFPHTKGSNSSVMPNTPNPKAKNKIDYSKIF